MRKASRISLKSQLKHLTGFFISITACVILFLIDSYDGIPETFKYLIICVLIIFSSVFFLHIQYLYFNAGIKIEFIDNENIIYYYRNGKEKLIEKDDIFMVEKHVSYAHIAGGRYFLPTDNYYFQKIRLINGDFFIITSLLLPDFSLFPEKTLVKKRIIAFIT